jgi:hypothetical protein
MSDSLNLYINFLLYAIVGKMGEADDILRQYKQEIYDIAAHSLRGYVPNVTLYRGVLLEPCDIKDGKLYHDQRLTFVSYSEDQDVARWFADVKSIMSSYVRKQRPKVEGYLIRAIARQDMVLFAATAQPTLCKLLSMAAEMHPHIDASQLRWNLATQKEVILKPSIGGLDVIPYTSDNTKALDDKFTHPLFR